MVTRSSIGSSDATVAPHRLTIFAALQNHVRSASFQKAKITLYKRKMYANMSGMEGRMPFSFSIKIRGPAGAATFDPNPLSVKPDDDVSWGNCTNDAHHPWPTRENGDLLTDAEVTGSNAQKYLSDEIPGQQSSRPSWIAFKPEVTTTIFYCCKIHPTERGKIIIVVDSPAVA
jgi:plastocyanin